MLQSFREMIKHLILHLSRYRRRYLYLIVGVSLLYILYQWAVAVQLEKSTLMKNVVSLSCSAFNAWFARRSELTFSFLIISVSDVLCWRTGWVLLKFLCWNVEIGVETYRELLSSLYLLRAWILSLKHLVVWVISEADVWNFDLKLLPKA